LITFALHTLRCSALALFIAVSTFSFTSANDSFPFVVGFERFGRHQEIDSAQAGQLLVTELSCTSCHVSPAEHLKPKGGPSLASAGLRLNAGWVEKYLESPMEVDSGSTMPNMLASVPAQQRKSVARALASYLTTLVEPLPEPKATGANPIPMEFYQRGDEQNGKRLFHTVGCVACHAPADDYDVATVQPTELDKMIDTLDPEELKELGLSSAARRVESIPLPELRDKYTRKSLTYFLLYPDHVRPSSRMPSLSLKPVEAGDIAAYLIPNESSATPAANRDSKLVAQGKALFSELRCANCHQVSAKQPPGLRLITSKPLSTLKAELPATSCVATSGSIKEVQTKRGQPSYRVDEQQLSALRSALASQNVAIKQETTLQLQLIRLNCYGCHQRNELGGVDRYRKPFFETVNNIDIGDEGRLPPSLTNVGKRLQTAWMEKVLKGEGAIRPHMTIRMPVYNASFVKSLPTNFEAIDNASGKKQAAVFAMGDKQALFDAGRQLMDAGCVQCHQFRGRSLPGVVGVDLENIGARVHDKWLHDFLLDPGALKSRTRMPSFFPEGKSQYPNILDGNVELQISAMAAYLGDLKNQQLPQKIEDSRSQNFELTPKDRPIVLRTFMTVGGLQSIAVGFPQKVHFAFDADRCSISEAWKNKFLDAESTWFDRFAKPTQPLGESVTLFPSGPAVAVLANKNSAWPASAQLGAVEFKGYQLDGSGVPTFSYLAAGYLVTERIEPAMENENVTGLRRKLSIVAAKEEDTKARLWFRAMADKKPQAASSRPENSFAGLVGNNGVTVLLMNKIPFGEVRVVGGLTEWNIPFDFDENQSATIELLYLWK
jgi:mono/diheme cytochrome c family protein